MEKILGTVYGYFEFLFGSFFAEYLWGYNCDTQAYDNPNLFNSIGLTTIAIALAIVLLYYYFLNHPRLNGAGHWFIFLLLASAINLLVAYFWTVSDYVSGNIQDCLQYTRDEAGNILAQLIYKTDCWKFGIANAWVSAIVFVIFSFMLKWWSSNCKHSPTLLKYKK
ncbi:MAG: hypothetical protein EZS26_000204 [Candidatus Ordinivivax streblomastigis]|uniref:Uncharacterized protein n=1 Tax=Candidatus Ordinivivax streblomastigis TaxID=2540710 RepID=A0A5M8P5B6_9BACT|nr:MAG: hypothetical protein EZS26_000204 [Candidatus Ordinivivax streblomastigis]